MAIRLLRWQGPARTRACRELLVACLGDWAKHWCALGEALDATPVALSPEAESRRWRGARHSGASVWLGYAPAGLAALGASLVGEAQLDTSGLGERLATRSVDDLLARMLRAPTERLEKVLPPDDADLAPFHGGIGFSLSGPLADWVLLLDAGACDLLAPIRPIPREPLSSRPQALGPERVMLDVVLPLGELALSESLSLRVGEVLLAGSLLDAAVRVQTASGRPVAEGALARQGEGRAIRIESNLIKQGHSK
ncbi:MAG TPA: hypothetical protein VFQ84_09055 [Arenimonas sp.]|uniref:hypothetical protein n=1 Tax=Arenimonas sp. TaxID=1872635 RepID=UPI002D7E506C|nr:hypothetical protein [Arenimonas sp.]HEU0153478.1 hypothetical protein [Arenimonas sp.]